MPWPLSSPESPQSREKEEMFYYLSIIKMHSTTEVTLQFHPAQPWLMFSIMLPGACMSQLYLCADLCASASF